jgi:hypothetical protein
VHDKKKVVQKKMHTGLIQFTYERNQFIHLLQNFTYLNVHQYDCVPNVLYFLNILTREEAIQFAMLNNAGTHKMVLYNILNNYVITKSEGGYFLNLTEYVPIEEIYNFNRELQNNSFTIIIVNYKNSDISHVLFIAKDNNKLCFIDPQSQIIVYNNENNYSETETMDTYIKSKNIVSFFYYKIKDIKELYIPKRSLDITYQLKYKNYYYQEKRITNKKRKNQKYKK